MNVQSDVRVGTPASPELTREELQLATRNHGMPLEALRYPSTPVGLHYVLVHYDIPVVDPDAWRLTLSGRFSKRLELSLHDIEARPAVSRRVTMECAGNGRATLTPRAISQPWLHEAVGNAEWTGTPLRPLLDEAGLADDAVEVVFTGMDRGVEGGIEQRYERSLPVDELRSDDVLLAYAMNGASLPPQHGYPVRLLVPGWYGMTSVKWLTAITAVAAPFEGYQQLHSYRFRQRSDDPGEPVTRQVPRSLMAPPGIPEFFSRHRVVHLGPCELEGRAWSGSAAIARVEVSTDGGATWQDAALDEQPDPRCWRRWSHRWDPTAPGTYVLLSRATDATGATQPLEPQWNLGGYAVNAVQRVTVTVR